MAEPILDKRLTMDEQADFVMSFVDQSAEERDDLEHIWDVVEQNFLVRPIGSASDSRSTRFPFLTPSSSIRSHNTHRSQGFAVLKDPETHQEVMTIVASIVGQLFPEPGYIKARPVGFEDVLAAKTVGGLIEYAHRIEGHFWAFLEWVLSMCIYGTGVMEASWEFREEPREFRRIEFDPLTETETSESTILNVPIYDDVRYRTLDVRDCFPDPGNTLIADMVGFAKRFKITAQEAMDRADRGVYRKEVVKEAIDRRSMDERGDDEDQDKLTDDLSEMGPIRSSPHEFMELTGFEYVGMTPFKTDDGIQKRVITVLEGGTARSRPWPRRVPFFECKIIPRLGSFFAISPGEVIRHDQDFADVIKMMLADAVVRMTHPPNIVSRQANVRLAKLRRFSPDVPIDVDGPANAAISQTPYNPPIQPAFAMQSEVKQQMREGTGMLDVLQGIGFGTKRSSATEFAGVRAQASVRPELFARIMEQEFMPPLGLYTLNLYQQFLEPGTDDLQRRIGETTLPVPLATIMADFDIQFVGSRIGGERAQKVEAFREIAQAGASNPILQQITPWIPLVQKWFKDLGADEIAAMVGNPQLVQLHLMLQQQSNPQSLENNGNNFPETPDPLGALPAQLAGGTQ